MSITKCFKIQCWMYEGVFVVPSSNLKFVGSTGVKDGTETLGYPDASQEAIMHPIMPCCLPEGPRTYHDALNLLVIHCSSYDAIGPSGCHMAFYAAL